MASNLDQGKKMFLMKKEDMVRVKGCRSKGTRRKILRHYMYFKNELYQIFRQPVCDNPSYTTHIPAWGQ